MFNFPTLQITVLPILDTKADTLPLTGVEQILKEPPHLGE